METVFLCHMHCPVVPYGQPFHALSANYVVFRSNTQAVTVGASGVLGRCLYCGNLFLTLVTTCAQLFGLWGSYRFHCQVQGMSGAELLTGEVRVITNKRMIDTYGR